jgi:thioredoxin reductase (NADPH)
VIIATGTRCRRPDVPGIERFEGTSVFCTPLAAGDRLGTAPIIVVGGNSAGQASTAWPRISAPGWFGAQFT